MNWDIVEGNWKQLKGSVREQWGKLTNDELDQAEGNREKLVGLIQEKYGKTKADVEQAVDNFFKEKI